MTTTRERFNRATLARQPDHRVRETGGLDDGRRQQILVGNGRRLMEAKGVKI